MSIEPQALVPGGLAGVMVCICGYAALMFRDWRKDRREGVRDASTAVSARVQDRATEIASLVQTVEVLQKQNDRQAVTIERQEMEINQLREEQTRQRLEHRAQIEALEARARAQNDAWEKRAAALQKQVTGLQMEIRQARGGR